MSLQMCESSSNRRAQTGPPRGTKSLPARLWEWLQPFARFWGLVTAIVLNVALVYLHYLAPDAPQISRASRHSGR
ncbi:hypothetical protein EVAR_84968_1 [Eumeta japonica]|uniref:Uncharacterized protein n=1 Tax=Eumeta variegata TaxID=151549 RepID=A0A4C1VHM6_EUMVA|nr:hypothetical protein EVAR_84968_1 [Eumeta japonica]